MGCWDGSVQDPCHRVWTILSLEDWNRAKKAKVIQGNPATVSDPRLGPAFAWLQDEMQKRLGDEYKGGRPVISWLSPKPDLNQPTYLPPGTRAVCVECLVPKYRTIVFSKDGWAMVKSQWYVPLNEADGESFENSIANLVRFEDYQADTQQRIIDSWQRIFDLEVIRQGGYFDGRLIYAAAEEISMSEVVADGRGGAAVQHFISK